MLRCVFFIVLLHRINYAVVESFASSTIIGSKQHKQTIKKKRTYDGRRKMVENSRDNDDNDEMLAEKFGGYTVKQRLREEIESPFRNLRLYLFGVSTASALLALYFSAFSALKGYLGGFSNIPPLEESLQSCAINVGAVLVCGFLTYRDYVAGEANLERISKGGALARLRVISMNKNLKHQLTMKDYRRNSRVVIAVGGDEYISTLLRSLSADQRSNSMNLVDSLKEVNAIIVPVLLEDNGKRVGYTLDKWQALQLVNDEDQNFDVSCADSIISIPTGNRQWSDYLKSEIETAQKQGFDVMTKGFTITVKKNGRILRRATGQPQWNTFISAMEVMDGSQFGMPGDSANNKKSLK